MTRKMEFIKTNYYFFITIIIIIFINNIICTPLPEYDNRARFNCPDMSSCSCSFVVSEYEIQCPASDPNIIVRIQPNTYVQIECTTMNEKEYAQLPIMNIGDIPMVQIRRCPLPIGRSIQAILERLGTKHVRALLFQSYGADLGNTLIREHLKGFGELERLVLSGNGLSDLPSDLFLDVGNLTWLDLKSNKVHLPRDIFLNLEKLDYLELGYNNLKNLESGVFRNQKRLKHLNLWGNNLQNLTKTAFDGVSSIMELDLSSNNIETFHSDVFILLKNLTNLNLNGNKFKKLPENLFMENKKLTRFRLMDNRINLNTLPRGLLSNLPELDEVRIRCHLIEIPENLFAGSINLRNISLSGNLIDMLPSSLFAEQTNLLDLDLSRNKLIELHDDLFANTRALLVLSLSHNQLMNISRNLFSHLHSLRELYLDNNNLYRIHSNAFSTSQSLQIIQLQNNHLSFKNEETSQYIDYTYDIGSPFQNLNELHTLNLRNNSIRNIYRDWMFNTPQLNELDLSYNNITMLSNGDLQFLSRQITINLTHNSIVEIDFRDIEFMDPDQESKTVIVLLENNPIICNCILLHFVQFLRNEIGIKIKSYLEIIPGNLVCSSPKHLEGKLLIDVEPKELLCPLDSNLSSIKRCPNQCECWVRPVDKALIVNCSNVGLTKIPLLPRPLAMGLHFIELHIENNNIIKLPQSNTPGYESVRELYAQNNNLTTFTIDNMPANMTILNLANNHLKWINSSVFEQLNQTQKLEKISLSGNPWTCDCNALHLLSFIRVNFKKIQDFNQIKCISGEKISVISINDLCNENENIIIASSIIIALLGLLIGILAALYYKYQQEVKVWLFAHNMCLWFVTEEELDKDKKYDAFLSYSHKDEDFITEHLVPNLENGVKPFKLCLHERDWTIGEFIPNQIVKSVEDSRRTIVVLSSNFIESIWGRMEFRAAHSSALSEGRARVIVIIYGDIGNIENLDSELKAYLNMNTYVKWGDPWFWEKLRYAMPHPINVQRTKGLIKTSIKSSTDDKLELIKPLPVTPPLTTPPAEQATKNPLVTKLNGEIKQNGKLSNGGTTGINGHVNGAFIINTNAKQSDV